MSGYRAINAASSRPVNAPQNSRFPIPTRVLLMSALVAAVAIGTGCIDDEEPVSQNDDPNNASVNDPSNDDDNDDNDDPTPPDENDNDDPNDRDRPNDINDGVDNNDPDQTAPGDPPVPGVDPGWVGGRSVEDRPIVVEHYGDDGPVLFVLSAIHGHERLAVTYGERFRTQLQAGFAQHHGLQVVFMQATNPDGIAIYERHNVNDIDLNRNFPTSNFSPGGPGGDTPLSEPEAEAIRDAVDASGLSAVLTVHCCVPGFDHDGPAEPLAEAMSQAMDPAHRFDVIKLGASPGSLGSYVGLDMNRPIITVEFDTVEGTDPFVQLAQMDLAFDAAASWTFDNPGGDAIDFEEMTTEDEWSYRSDYAGSSAAGQPLRVESIGAEDDQRYVLLSGFDGEDMVAPWTAEHIRRVLLALPQLDAGFWQMITAANPDGLAGAGPVNDDGVDIRSSVAAGDDSSAEAAAVLDVLDDSPATVFLVTNSDDGTDRVYLTGPDSDDLSEHVPSDFSTTAPEDTALADALASQGHTAVRIAVATETLEAQNESRQLASGYDSPFDFSDMVLRMAGR